MKSYYSEFLGTCFLLIAIVGSGMMGQKMTNDFGIILLANSIAIGFALIVLIIVFADISGAHFNPVVSISMYLMKEISFRKALIYILIQLAGAIVGVMLANKMFGFSAINESMNERSGVALFISEIISTFGLLLVIFGTKKKEKIIVALCVGMYISSAIWFSSSTSFANPAVSIARTLTDSFTGSRMQDMPFFIFAQIIGTIIATFFIGGWLFKKN
jgi:glycerol uptake facilitator-like aquaporin